MKKPNRNEWRNWSKNNPPEEHFDAMLAALRDLFMRGSLVATKAERDAYNAEYIEEFDKSCKATLKKGE